MRATGRTPREHYNSELTKAQAEKRVGAVDGTTMRSTAQVSLCPKISGGLGIPRWKPMSKATAKWMLKNGKLPSTPENLERAGMGKAPRKKENEREKLLRELARLTAENEGLKNIKL